MDFTTMFLVVNRSVADFMRANGIITGYESADARRVAVPMLGSGERVGGGKDSRGEVVLLRCRSGGRELIAEVVIGVGRDGRPSMAPDGKKRVAFLTDLRYTHKAGRAATPGERR